MLEFCVCGVFHPVRKTFVPVGAHRTKVLERIEVPELLVDEASVHSETIDLSTRPGMRTHRRAPIPGPMSFAISLAAYIEKVTGTCPFYCHDKDAEVSDDEEEEIDSIFVMTIRL
jgi:hypothetical protein